LHTIILGERRGEYADDPSHDNIAARFEPLIQAAIDVLKTHEADENGKKWVRVSHRTVFGPGRIRMEDKLWTKDIQIGG
jgi:hypothetical protein